ncbi:MAG: hypothetical protein ACR2NB_13940 [Solirubrobacteraceae bacterium]
MPSQRQRNSWSDREAVVAAMVHFLGASGTTHANRRAYAKWATGRGDAPAASRLDQHGGFAAVREEALARLREQRAVVGSDDAPAISKVGAVPRSRLAAPAPVLVDLGHAA